MKEEENRLCFCKHYQCHLTRCGRVENNLFKSTSTAYFKPRLSHGEKNRSDFNHGKKKDLSLLFSVDGFLNRPMCTMPYDV
mmetsp:Transcript_28295/g.59541  ORF Transcript_28295/g.59541 Transcript_28295/m.59541 type:complete len:81 (-) Transcript_28295:463-705(-)